MILEKCTESLVKCFLKGMMLVNF